ncbi:CD40 ligand [Nematolebias whitei]|uniref:CD40 ligand n=1 Tax=Nematolebias whitei TaxID=451745 RepID=UPI0018987DB9|nr:CD40 ligand [Nematolebias whitei]
MIDTSRTSMAPPPVPSRLQKPQPILIPASHLPSEGHSKPLVHFLVGVVLLHFALSVGGFLFLYYKEEPYSYQKLPSFQGRVGFSSAEKQEDAYKAWARMVVERQLLSNQISSGYLRWDIQHSVRKSVSHFHSTWLTILEPGDYFVYSRVTFSKDHPKLPLASRVMMRKTEKAEEQVVMKAYCSLSSNSSNPNMCTATQQDLITLEKGNQLSIWVQVLSLVDYEEGATAFGIYKL